MQAENIAWKLRFSKARGCLELTLEKPCRGNTGDCTDQQRVAGAKGKLPGCHRSDAFALHFFFS